MFWWIIKKTIPDYQQTTKTKVRERYGIVCSILSIFCNGFMVVFKMIFGLLTRSIAIQADAFNNLSDMGSNIATLCGFKMAGKHPDEDHPYGHGRYEYIAGLIISFIILIVALSSLKESIMKIIEPEILKFQIGAVIVLILSILMKLWMSHFNKIAGEHIQSSSLKAASQDSLNDVFMTTATLISLCLSTIVTFPLDGIIGAGVSLFVLKSGFDIFKETVDPLLGKAPNPELIDEIKDYVLSYPKIIGIHDFMIHDYGPGRRYMTFHAEVNSHEDFMKVHEMIDGIERDMLDRYHILTTIHMDPVEMNDELTNKLRQEVYHIIKELHSQYDIHDFRIVKGKKTRLIFDVLVPFDDEIQHQKLKTMIENEIKKIDINYECVIQIDHTVI